MDALLAGYDSRGGEGQEPPEKVKKKKSKKKKKVGGWEEFGKWFRLGD